MNNIGVATHCNTVIKLINGEEIFVIEKYNFIIDEMQKNTDKLVFITTYSPFGKLGITEVYHAVLKDKIALITEIKPI